MSKSTNTFGLTGTAPATTTPSNPQTSTPADTAKSAGQLAATVRNIDPSLAGAYKPNSGK